MIGKSSGVSHPAVEKRRSGRKILVRSTNWLGDVVLSFPFLAELRRREPEAEITVLARPRVASILQNQPGVDRIVLDRNEGLHRGLSGFFNLAGDLASLHFSRAYVLPNSFGSALQLWLAGIPERIGFATDGRRLFLTRAIRKTPALRRVHETRLYLRLLDIEPDREAPLPSRLVLTEKEQEDALACLTGLSLTPMEDQPRIGMIPGAAFGSAKRWPVASFARLARRLVNVCQARVLLFGAPSEKEVADRIVERAGTHVINLAGRTTLRQLAALLAGCRVVVSNDTGSMHVAAAVGVPVVALFGPTDPVTTAPGGRGHRLLREPVDCSPCLLRHCPTDHRCMDGITPEWVLEQVLELLNDGPGSSD